MKMHLDLTDVPASGDGRWAVWTKPLRKLLTKPRDWKELGDWGKTHKIDGHMLRQCLAWLEDQGLAKWVESDGQAFWVSTIIRAKPLEPLVSSQE